jgi:predicted anti-sigma-YlaC factor YlaD
MVNERAVSCELVWHEISNYLEGNVDAGLRQGMDEHFRTCSRCKSLLDGARNVMQV